MAQNRADSNGASVSRLYGLASAFSRVVPMAWWPVVATLLVQAHVLGNGFLFDDFVHLYSVSNLPFLQAISVPMGGHMLHSYATVIWLVKSLFGLNPFVYLLIGLLVHLLSVRILFSIVVHLTERQGLAAFCATLWGMSPMAAGTLGWISVHGQAYATVAILWVLLDTTRCSRAAEQLATGMLLRHALLLLVASTSFGAGLTSTVVWPLLIALWNPVPAQRKQLLAVYGAVALAAIALYVMTMMQQGEARDNLDDKIRLVSGTINNLLPITRGFAGLICIGTTAPVLGPLLMGKIALVPTESLVTIASLCAVCLALPLLVWSCSESTPSERRRIFALLLLPCAAYGMIAVARTTITFVVQPEALRYHYLTSAIVVMVWGLVLAKVLDRLPARGPEFGRIAYLVWLLLVIVPFAVGPAPASKEAHIRMQNRQFKESSLALQKALQNNQADDAIYIENKPFVVFIWGYTPNFFPGLAALYILSYPSNEIDGKRVYFLEESEELVRRAQARKGSRIAEILVHSPGENGQ